MPVDEDQLNDLIGQFVTDLDATVQARNQAGNEAGNVVIGDRLGRYRAVSEIGPADAGALARHTGTSERYQREWVAGQAGEAAVHRIATAAGFTRVRRATETPFNIICEVRP